MSQKQKNESSSADKWRDLTEQETKNERDEVVDDEHLLADESLEPSSKKLDDQINLLEKQIILYKDQVARAQALEQNTHKRLEQEVSKARKFGVERLVSELVPVMDGLVHGMEGAISDDPQIQQMKKGMELTLDILNKVLENNGIKQINPVVGDVFDPMQHEAVSMRSDPNAKANTILQVLQKGYALNGRVIRAAMVIVAA